MQDMTMGRLGGALYLAIIGLGLTSEVALRGPLAGDPAAIAAAPMLWRASLMADLLMVCADVALAVVLFGLLRRVAPGVALAAMAFRLMQAASISAALLFHLAALTLVEAPALTSAETLTQVAVSVQAAGYDMGLLFFGVNCLLTGWLVARSPLLPAGFGYGLAAAGLVYLTGSTLRVLAPEAFALFTPAYLIPVVAETAFALWLLVRGARSPAEP